MRVPKPAFGVFPFILMLALILSAPVFADGLLVISNKNISDVTLTKGDVQKIYSGKKTKWGNNDTIVVTVLDGSEAHNAFLKEFVKKSPSQFKMTWKKMVFTGKGTAPQKFKDMKSLVEFVEKTDGAIGYITPEFVTDNVNVITKE